MTECVIEFQYIRLLDTMANTLEYSHTATWVPPYHTAASDPVAAAAGTEVDAEPAFAARVTYSLSYAVSLWSSSGILSLDCVQPIKVRPVSGSLHTWRPVSGSQLEYKTDTCSAALTTTTLPPPSLLTTTTLPPDYHCPFS